MTQGIGDQYKVILSRRNPAGQLLGDILHLGFDNPRLANPLAIIQRTFIGEYLPLEVFTVERTALTPEGFCEYLSRFNPGTQLRFQLIVCFKSH
jgi:hypothetical protein